MMNVQVPIFPGFSNIGICPGPFPGIAVYILDKVEKTDHLSSELKEISFKYLPYYQNHVYILFPDTEVMKGDVHFYGSDGDLQSHLHYHLGSRQLHGRYLNVSVSKTWIPHLTVPLENFEFKSEVEIRNQTNCERKEISKYKKEKKMNKTSKSKKNYKIQNQKKIQNCKNKDKKIKTKKENINQSDKVTPFGESKSQEIKNKEIFNEIIQDFATSEKNVDVPQICTNLLEELLLDAVSRGERCSLCFVTHFPWLKVCRKNNKKSAPIKEKFKNEQMQPKLRGGARTPKFLITDSDNIKKLLSILRSLDVLTKKNDHEKCELAASNIQDSLCEFCLIRSLIIRSNELKGRTKIKPIEFLGYDEE